MLYNVHLVRVRVQAHAHTLNIRTAQDGDVFCTYNFRINALNTKNSIIRKQPAILDKL